MIFSKSMTFDEEEMKAIGLATGHSSSHSDAETQFIEKLKEGNARAFDVLVDQYGSHVYGLLLKITQDPEEAGDLTQETFLSALKGIRKFRGDSGLRTWLFRIAINQSRNRFRWWKRRKKDKTVSIDAKAPDREVSLSDRLPGSELNPEEKLLQNERGASIMRAIESLPETYKEAVILCDIKGLAYEEIAEILEINIGTVKSRIARGRKELRVVLADI